LDEDTAIHAHGVRPPANMDGVPCYANGILPSGASLGIYTYIYVFI
jgi:hypothetical protein